MKKIKMIIATVAMAGVLFVAGLSGSNLIKPSYAEDNKTEQKIEVRGEAIIKVKPDVAFIDIGVETEDKNSKVAQDENKKLMNNVFNTLKELNIDEKDIQTKNYSIYPKHVYNDETRESTVSGYRVNNSLKVTIRDIENIGDVIDAVSKEGANKIQSISFGTLKEDIYYLDALEEAVNNAKLKANRISKTIGVTIDKPSEVLENFSGGAVYRELNYSAKVMSADAMSTPISEGEIEVRASVTLKYLY